MGQRAEELRQEITATRSDLGDTLDAIGDRVSPGRMVERRKAGLRARVTRLREQVMGSTDAFSSRFVDGRSGTTSSGVAGTVGDMASSTGEALREAPEVMRRSAQGNPLLAGAIAFGAGLLVASVLPKSDTEQEAAGQVAEGIQPVKDALTQAGQHVASVARDSASEIAEQAKSQASDASRQVKESAVQAAGQVKADAQGAAETVTDEASAPARSITPGTDG